MYWSCTFKLWTKNCCYAFSELLLSNFVLSVFFLSWDILSAALKSVYLQFVWMVRNKWRFLGNAAMNAKVSQRASAVMVSGKVRSKDFWNCPMFVCFCLCVVESGASCFYQGTSYHSNEQWEVDECTRCTCVSGDVHCHSERCPPLTCATVSVTDTHFFSVST